MKKHFTIVLTKNITIAFTIALAAMTFLGRPSAAQVSSEAALAAKGYDQSLLHAALAPVPQPNGMTGDEQAILNEVNALRAKNNLAPLAPDPALAASARYLVLDEVKAKYFGNFAYTSSGQVTPDTMAADYGSGAANIGNSQYSNLSFPFFSGHWQFLVQKWVENNIILRQIVADPSLTTAGVGLADTGHSTSGWGHTFHIVQWSIFVGKPGDNTPPPPSTDPLYRLDSPDGGRFFLTANQSEYDSLVSRGWGSHGAAGQIYADQADASGLTPLYRLYNRRNADHFYTASAHERDFASRIGYKLEGTAGYLFSSNGPGLKPLFRAYNPSTGQHLFTGDQGEYSGLAAPWHKEGIAGYMK